MSERVALVTGAGGGIGQEIVRVLVARGWDVVAADVTPGSIAAICGETGALPLVMDVTDERAVEQIDSLEMTAVVNCAGWGATLADPVDFDIAVFDRAMAINARGTLLVIKYAARSMIRRGVSGSIVNFSSQAALVALPGHTVYAASKAAVDSITRTSALSLGRHGIRVNAVNPTTVMTAMSLSHWSRPEIAEPFLASMPLARWATEADIAGPVAFLLSDDAAMITGVSLPIDGGYTIQ